LMVLSVLEVLVGMTSPIMVANCRCCFSSFGVLMALTYSVWPRLRAYRQSPCC